MHRRRRSDNIDTLSEARKVLIQELSSTLFPIARDVKIQIEFNPTRVAEYRLIGYETRALKREDFNNDKVDAGDVGSGHSITAIYEITPVGAPRLVEDLRYGKAAAQPAAAAGPDAELGFLRLRYKLPKEEASRLLTLAITPALEKRTVAEAPAEVRFSTAVAAFGQLVRGLPYLKTYGYDDVIALANGAKGDDPFGYRARICQPRAAGEIRTAMRLVHIAGAASDLGGLSGIFRDTIFFGSPPAISRKGPGSFRDGRGRRVERMGVSDATNITSPETENFQRTLGTAGTGPNVFWQGAAFARELHYGIPALGRFQNDARAREDLTGLPPTYPSSCAGFSYATAGRHHCCRRSGCWRRLHRTVHRSASAARVIVRCGAGSCIVGWGGSGRAFGQVVPYAKHDHEHVLRTFGAEYGERLIDGLGSGPDLVFDLIARYATFAKRRRRD